MQDSGLSGDNEDKLSDIIHPPLYPRMAIWWFSFLITPVFGSVMLMQNLKDIGKRKEGNLVFIITLACTLIFAIFMATYDAKNNYMTIIFNAVGAGFLSTYFKQNIPGASLYPKKKLTKPLIIAFAILLLFVLAFIGEYYAIRNA